MMVYELCDNLRKGTVDYGLLLNCVVAMQLEYISGLKDANIRVEEMGYLVDLLNIMFNY